VVVAVIAVGMVQVTSYQVVGVISVRHRLMTTSWPVLMSLVVLATIVMRRAVRWICLVHIQVMFLDSSLAHVMEMTLVQVVRVAVVLDGRVSTGRFVLMSGHTRIPSGRLRRRIEIAPFHLTLMKRQSPDRFELQSSCRNRLLSQPERFHGGVAGA
jgi:hypothetical protein